MKRAPRAAWTFDRPAPRALHRAVRRPTYYPDMTVGGSIFLIALGAILYFALETSSLGPIELQTVGLILMIVGIVGLVFALLYLRMWAPRRRGDREVVREREVL